MAKFGAWRKIPQWFAGIFFIAALAAALMMGGLVGLSSPETAKPILTNVLKEALLQTEAARNFEQIQPYLKTLPPDQPLSIPGFPKLDITTGEAGGLSRDGLAERIAKEMADKSYEGRLELPPQSEMDANTVEPLGTIFSANAHQSISNLNMALWALAALMAAVLVIFSSRFGRLASLGLGMIGGSIFPLAVYSLLAARIETAGNASAGASEEMQMLVPILESIKPTLAANQRLALTVLALGAALLTLAVIGSLVFRRKGPA